MKNKRITICYEGVNGPEYEDFYEFADEAQVMADRTIHYGFSLQRDNGTKVFIPASRIYYVAVKEA